MSRLIDVDELIEILEENNKNLQDKIDNARTEVQKVVYEAQEFSTMEMIRVIKEQPTAFDVNKVLKKISERNREYQEKYRECQEEEREMAEEIFYQRAKTMAEAYDIVKAGGIDEDR